MWLLLLLLVVVVAVVAVLTVSLSLTAGVHLVEKIIIVGCPGLESVDLTGPHLHLLPEVAGRQQGGELRSGGDVFEERSQCGVRGTDGSTSSSLSEQRNYINLEKLYQRDDSPLGSKWSFKVYHDKVLSYLSTSEQ